MIDSIEKFYETQQVDQDFDVSFYQKEYPETKDFYQPYCQNNKIDDKYRLFFHWYNYAKDIFYKNLQDKTRDTFIPKISHRTSIVDRLAIITCYYNPCNFVNIKHNYNIFAKKIKSFGELFPIELSFDGDFFINDPNCIRVIGDQSNVLWQKERLLNIVLNQLPKRYTTVAWIDCDIIFCDPLWTNQLFELLNSYKVIHLFNRVYRLDGSNNIYQTNTSIISNIAQGSTGFCWAARREVLDEIKFLDNQIIGGADLVMTAAFMNRLDLIERRKHKFIDNDYTKQWIYKTANIVDKSVNNLNSEIKHLYHGSMINRQYDTRTKYIDMLQTAYQENGIWKNASLNNEIFNYFQSRYEDDNIITPNYFFDQIYVLNLDMASSKMENIKKKLDILNIKHRRFSAINGAHISCDTNTFVKGSGDLENNYALGCLLSHIEIVKDAKNNNYKNILIFEDDIMFLKEFLVYFQNIKSINKWKLIYFGGSQHCWENIEYIDNFYLSKKTLGTFAYAVDSSIFDEILQFSNTKTIDQQLSLLQDKYYGSCYTFYPNICIADVTESTIRTPRDQSIHNRFMKWNSFNYE